MAEKTAAPKKKRYRLFPSTKGMDKNGRPMRLIDLDKVKEIYLSGPDYDWTPFCNRNGFDPNTNWNKWKTRGFDFKEWKVEWLRRQAVIQDEELAPEVLAVRKAVATQRIKFVKDWTARTEYMKALLDAMLRKHGEHLEHDMRNATLIRQGQINPKFSLESEEFSYLTSTAHRLQEIETRALLLTSDKMHHPTIGVDGAREEHDEPPEFKVATMKSAGLSGAEIAKLLSSWFDQAPQALPSPPGESDDPAPDNG